MIKVHEARPEEFDEAGRVTALAYREFVGPGEADWEAYLEEIADVGGRAGRAMILVAVDGDTILGSATLELDRRIDDESRPLDPDEAHVRMLGVDPAARGRGAAQNLMAASEGAARAHGKRRISLHTTQRMTVAQGMYERLGFKRAADRVLEDGFILLTYEKLLDPLATGSSPGTTRAEQPPGGRHP
ncbi:MAG: GNAT family N-acetyltransferase [Actinomycetota bacterium]